jgi:hypothetical protein
MAIRNREEGIREIAINLMAFIEKEYRIKRWIGIAAGNTSFVK